jgi:hypothetical protein
MPGNGRSRARSGCTPTEPPRESPAQGCDSAARRRSLRGTDPAGRRQRFRFDAAGTSRPANASVTIACWFCWCRWWDPTAGLAAAGSPM